jgi:hypothetical protein
MSVYLPEEQALLGTRGPWNQEQFNPWRVKFSEVVSVVKEDFGWSTKTDREIYSELTEGVSISGDPVGSFGVQGDRFLFSTLRPEAPPRGALRVNTLDNRWLNFTIIVVAIAIGFGLIGRPIPHKLLVVGLIVILLVIGGVFWPTAAMEIIDGKLVLAGILVVLVWFTAATVRKAGWLQDLPTWQWPWQRHKTRAVVENGPEQAEKGEKGGTP